MGRPIKELSKAWNLRIEDQGQDSRQGGRAFTAYLPRLGEVAPQLFEQKSLFGDDLDPEDTVFDWLGDVTTAIIGESRDSRRLDADLLNHLARYRHASENGIDDAWIETRRYRTEQVHVNDELGLKALSLGSETPAPRRTRIKGVLNTLAFLERGVLLNLDKGNRLHVLWNPEDLEPLRSLWGQSVLVEGQLQYKPNGHPLILIADAIRPATSQDMFWDDLPIVNGVSHHSKLTPGGVNPLSKLAGLLDGVVENEEFFEMVEAMS